jgi:hypothetical protein
VGLRSDRNVTVRRNTPTPLPNLNRGCRGAASWTGLRLTESVNSDTADCGTKCV